MVASSRRRNSSSRGSSAIGPCTRASLLGCGVAGSWTFEWLRPPGRATRFIAGIPSGLYQKRPRGLAGGWTQRGQYRSREGEASASTGSSPRSPVTTPSTTCATSPKSPTRSTTACVRELAELEADWPDLVRPDSPTQRVGAPAVGGEFRAVRAPRPDAVARKCDGRGRVPRLRRARPASARLRIARGVRRRAQAGRRRGGAGLRERPPRGRRDPGGWTRRRGRHRQSAPRAEHSRRRCATADAARARLGPRRGRAAAARLPAPEPAARGARRRALREPAQRRGRLAAPARRRRRRAAALARVPRLRDRRGPAGRRRDPGRRPSTCCAAGASACPTSAAVCAGVDAAIAFYQRILAARERAPDRSRRHRLQGEPHRVAAGDRQPAALAALGDRLQVPAAAGDHRRRGDRGATSAAPAR